MIAELLAATALATAEPRPTPASVDYAIREICLPLIRSRGRVDIGRLEVSRGPRLGLRRTWLVRGAATVMVAQTQAGGCSILASGDAAELRAWALAALAYDGRPPQQFGDRERESPAGARRQEGYCLRVGDRDVGVILETPKTSEGRPALAMTLEPDFEYCRQAARRPEG